MGKPNSGGALRNELERRLRDGRCAYCGAIAAPDRPLTREHVVPQARGGGRRDVRITVPACARCNQRRGCKEFVTFLLSHPRRITLFLDYLQTLPPDCLSEVDSRIFAEVYATVWLLHECAASGAERQRAVQQIASGRRLHRRRYAARRIVAAVGDRVERARQRSELAGGPSCLLPASPRAGKAGDRLKVTEHVSARMIGVLALLWGMPAEWVLRELQREERRLTRASGGADSPGDEGDNAARPFATVSAELLNNRPLPSLDAPRPQRRRRRVRVDARGGRTAGGRRARL